MSAPAQENGVSRPGSGIVYFGNEWFAENRTSSHHMARRLAGHSRLLYVDSPGMRAPVASGRDLRRIWTKLAQALKRPREVLPGLWHCTVPQLPWRTMPGIERLNRAYGAWAVRRAMRHVGIVRPILWFVLPHPSFMLDAVPHELAIYYCIDDYAAHPGVDAASMRACDDMLTRRADHVFVAPPALVAAKLAINPNTSFAPHGVDVAMFATAQDAATQVPAAAARLPHPVIGYFGLIAAWTDLEMLEAIARQRPQWNLLLVGHATVDVGNLARLPNVTMVGAQPYESLPGWAKAFDVAIIPYRLNEQVRNANPLKLREYLATGKPVVSVRTPEVERFATMLHIGEGVPGFISAIDAALREEGSNLRSRRMAAVRDMGWEQRADATLAIVRQALARRASGVGR
ncbi:MAG: glycosyltransferase [Betaproteobacteria bacterium]|nr:glycosyltransferase [Betaproteobacteria bacterium]